MLAAGFGNGYREFARKIAQGIAVGGFLETVDRSLIHDFSPETSGIGAYVDNMVGGAHYVLVMFHHHNRVAKALELAEHSDEFFRVAAVESDRRLVENVQRAYKAASE